MPRIFVILDTYDVIRLLHFIVRYTNNRRACFQSVHFLRLPQVRSTAIFIGGPILMKFAGAINIFTSQRVIYANIENY